MQVSRPWSFRPPRPARARGFRRLAGRAALCLLLATPLVSAAERAPVVPVRVLDVYPHDPQAFTQGLIYDGGTLYESTGLRGRSTLRRVDLDTGAVMRRHALDRRYFAEGLAALDGRLYQLTWQAGLGFVYDQRTFARTGRFRYDSEGWGLTHDGRRLIRSDGSDVLYFHDPADFSVTARLSVRDGERPVVRLNELEMVEGLLYANVWQTARIARIDPGTGRVVDWIDLGELLAAERRAGRPDVANGIAFDEQGRRLFVTGKRWRRLYHIAIPPLPE